MSDERLDRRGFLYRATTGAAALTAGMSVGCGQPNSPAAAKAQEQHFEWPESQVAAAAFRRAIHDDRMPAA